MVETALARCGRDGYLKTGVATGLQPLGCAVLQLSKSGASRPHQGVGTIRELTNDDRVGCLERPLCGNSVRDAGGAVVESEKYGLCVPQFSAEFAGLDRSQC